MSGRMAAPLTADALVGRLGAVGSMRGGGGGGEDVAAGSDGGVVDPRAVVAGGPCSARHRGPDGFDVFFAGAVLGLCQGNLVVVQVVDHVGAPQERVAENGGCIARLRHDRQDTGAHVGLHGEVGQRRVDVEPTEVEDHAGGVVARRWARVLVVAQFLGKRSVQALGHQRHRVRGQVCKRGTGIKQRGDPGGGQRGVVRSGLQPEALQSDVECYGALVTLGLVEVDQRDGVQLAEILAVVDCAEQHAARGLRLVVQEERVRGRINGPGAFQKQREVVVLVAPLVCDGDLAGVRDFQHGQADAQHADGRVGLVGHGERQAAEIEAAAVMELVLAEHTLGKGPIAVRGVEGRGVVGCESGRVGLVEHAVLVAVHCGTAVRVCVAGDPQVGRARVQQNGDVLRGRTEGQLDGVEALLVGQHEVLVSAGSLAQFAARAVLPLGKGNPDVLHIRQYASYHQTI